MKLVGGTIGSKLGVNMRESQAFFTDSVKEPSTLKAG